MGVLGSVKPQSGVAQDGPTTQLCHINGGTSQGNDDQVAVNALGLIPATAVDGCASDDGLGTRPSCHSNEERRRGVRVRNQSRNAGRKLPGLAHPMSDLLVGWRICQVVARHHALRFIDRRLVVHPHEEERPILLGDLDQVFRAHRLGGTRCQFRWNAEGSKRKGADSRVVVEELVLQCASWFAHRNQRRLHRIRHLLGAKRPNDFNLRLPLVLGQPLSKPRVGGARLMRNRSLDVRALAHVDRVALRVRLPLDAAAVVLNRDSKRRHHALGRCGAP